MLSFSGIASADAGVPMLFLTFPAMLIALVPIVAIETIIVARVSGTTALARAKSVGLANLASTVVGVPITWIALVLLQMVSGGGSAYGLDTPSHKLLAVTWQAPWLIPYEGDLFWMIPAASLVLLVPFFFTSYFVEKLVVFRLENGISRDLLRPAVLRANFVSYMLLGVFTVCWLLWSLHKGPSTG
jgi:hypothetical protein